MKKILPLLFLSLTTIEVGYCQSLHIDSTRFFTGNKCCTEIRYSIPTSDKGILFVGRDAGNPGGIIPYLAIDTGANGNVLIGKIDSNQKLSWIKVYGGSDADEAVSVCQTQDGGFAVLATTASNNGDVLGYKGGGGDLWLLRIDNLGTLLWGKTYGSSKQDGGMSIANTSDNGFILCGTTNGDDGDVPFHYGDFLSFDWLVIRTDSLGHIQWSKDLGGSGDELSNGSILSTNSGFYLVSATNSSDYSCTDSFWHSGVNTQDDFYVVKLDDTGRVLWDSSYGGDKNEQSSKAIFDVRDSTIVIVGVTNSGNYMVTGYEGSQDMWVVKVNKDGTLIWQKSIGSSDEEWGTGICADHGNGYVVYGWTHPGIGGGDCWLVQLDNLGNKINEKIFGGTGYDESSSVIPYLNGYVATGNSTSAIFTEGTSYGKFDGTPFSLFASYVDSGILAVNYIKGNEAQLLVYPNPNYGAVRIKYPTDPTGRITIVNSIGKMILAQEVMVQTQYLDINTDNWPDGVYLIKWQGETGRVQTIKLTKM